MCMNAQQEFPVTERNCVTLLTWYDYRSKLSHIFILGSYDYVITLIKSTRMYIRSRLDGFILT